MPKISRTFKHVGARALTVWVIALLCGALVGCGPDVAHNTGRSSSYKLPDNAELITMTWKDHSLWVLYFEPASKRCIFAERASLNVLDGPVVIENCTPYAPRK
jgi:ABC-type uncharacterized transport system auxiliary subunit